MIRPPPTSTLFPYTTLFRSWRCRGTRSNPRTRRRACRSDHPPRRPQECRSEEHTSELQSQSNLVCRLLLEKKNATNGRALADSIDQLLRQKRRDGNAVYAPP